MSQLHEDPARPAVTPEDAKHKARKMAKRNASLLSIYRTASRNHVSFVEISDRRANILISTCALIISVSFTFFLGDSLKSASFLIPGVIMIVTCTLTMVLAMLSTRPYNSRPFYPFLSARARANAKAPNLLFFQHFYKMKPDEYELALNRLLEDQGKMRQAVVRDLHGLGQSVARKYKYLRLSYDVLTLGIILAVLAMFVVVLRQHPAGS